MIYRTLDDVNRPLKCLSEGEVRGGVKSVPCQSPTDPHHQRDSYESRYRDRSEKESTRKDRSAESTLFSLRSSPPVMRETACQDAMRYVALDPQSGLRGPLFALRDGAWRDATSSDWCRVSRYLATKKTVRLTFLDQCLGGKPASGIGRGELPRFR
jgi:hypothetical protein